jgi:hypothetical protein
MRIAQKLRIATIAAATLLAGMHGCKDFGVESPASPPSLQLAVATPLTVLGKPAHEVLHITSAKILLRNISFRASGREDSVEIVSAPLVVDLDLTAKPKVLLIREVSASSYDRMRFTIHTPEDGEPLLDSVFAEGSDSSKRFSLIVTGLYHDTPFIFRSRQSVRIDIDFTSPVAIPATGSVNVTLIIDPYAWFTEGDLIYDPFNQTEKIDDLIKHAPMKAFRDNDRDGEPDR